MSDSTVPPHASTSKSESVETGEQLERLLLNDTESNETWLTLSFTWSGKSFTLEIAESDLVLDLKAILQSLTNVPLERQKILGLVKGKLPSDDARIADLKISSNKKFSLIGTPEGEELKAPPQPTSDADNEFDIDFDSAPSASANLQQDNRTVRKVKEAIQKLEDLHIIHPLREGKKLLVLDIDYTILDTKPLTSGSLPPADCARPGLHDFLEAIYPFYDICIWSQTSWIWLETKLIELGMIGGTRNYNISFVLDKTSMFTVYSVRDNKPWTHSVKALPIIWHKFPQFHPGNTIHVDDLSRNFALNPHAGLKISAFRNAASPEARADRELFDLARYLLFIAQSNDFRTLRHKDWKRVVRSMPLS